MLSWVGSARLAAGQAVVLEAACSTSAHAGSRGGTWSPALSLIGLLTLEKSHGLSGHIQTSVKAQRAADHPVGRRDQAALGAGRTATAQRVLQGPRVPSVRRDHRSQEGPSRGGGSPRTAPERRPSSCPDPASSGHHRESTALELEVPSCSASLSLCLK